MTEAEVRGLCIKSREIFLSQPILLELEAPLKICGENTMLATLDRHCTQFLKFPKATRAVPEIFFYIRKGNTVG